MPWTFRFHPAFDEEFKALDRYVRRELFIEARAIEMFGPNAGRPSVDTLKGSKFKNMKELRFTVSKGDERGEWRAAFAFDEQREAIILVAADKTGVAKDLFYKRLIAVADQRFTDHIAKQAKGTGGKTRKGK